MRLLAMTPEQFIEALARLLELNLARASAGELKVDSENSGDE
jgi:hypothetical protein